MSKKTYRIAEEVRVQILRRIKDDGVSVSQAAKDAGVSERTVYDWLGKGAEGAPSWAEFMKLKRENRALLELVGEITLKLSESQKKN
ncbi:MAG TPA: helix-turn-helix domain-containing protein [Candidatus Tyrphobacter sp.]|nr:helix-turn-helix domain-containing protein [Candidatus Tyrphobacter sp.]